jgi:serine/threonine protein kinase
MSTNPTLPDSSKSGPKEDSGNGGFDSTPISQSQRELFSESAPSPPLMIGSYRVIGTLGWGGMGIVYLAENSKISVPGRPGHQVALKAILSGQRSSLSVILFMLEMRSLLGLYHPNIARLFHADVIGTAEDMLPYFTMELIPEAQPITDFAKQKGLDLNARLKLLIAAAEGLGHAHSSGKHPLIHSDIKPENLLVGSNGIVKLVDFGGALDLSEPLPRARVITPRYAAPEQLEERIVSLRSDVYSLALVGYELLHNGLPISDTGAPTDGPLSINFDKHLRPEVVQVLSNGLQRDPNKRYADACEFVADLKRAVAGDFVKNEPHRLPKSCRILAQKNRFQVLIGIALLAGTIGTSWQAIEANHQRGLEKLARQRAESYSKSTQRALAFVKDLIFTADTYNVRDQTLDVDLFFKSADSKLSILANDERASAISLGALGRISANWGRFDQASAWLTRAISTWQNMVRREPLTRDESLELAQALNYLAWAVVGDSGKEGLQERAKQAVPYAEQAFSLQEGLSGAAGDDTLCFQADWLRIRQLAGDPALIDGFLDFLSGIAGQEKNAFLRKIILTIHEVWRLQQAGDRREATRQVRDLVSPFLDVSRPRMRSRVPWSMAQAGAYVRKLPKPVALMFGVSSEQLSNCGNLIVNVAGQIGNEILPAGHPDLRKIAGLKEEM